YLSPSRDKTHFAPNLSCFTPSFFANNGGGLSDCKLSPAGAHAASSFASFRDRSSRGQRHSLGSYEREVSGALLTGDHGRRVRVPGLRQRRLDGHLLG